VDIEIRPLERKHIDGAVALQRACFPPPFDEDLLWKAEHLERHLELFPEAQFVALDQGRVVGSASAVRISEQNWHAHHNWETTVGGHFLTAHDPLGSTLYGVDISVHPAYRGQSVGRKLYHARFHAVRQLGMLRFGTACRMPDFGSSSLTEPLTYASEVAIGKRVDRTLTPLLRYGLHLVDVISDYMEDAESGNAAALLEWRP
jgi:GNAT superfamily N-acetyltransferase